MSLTFDEIDVTTLDGLFLCYAIGLLQGQGVYEDYTVEQIMQKLNEAHIEHLLDKVGE